MPSTSTLLLRTLAVLACLVVASSAFRFSPFGSLHGWPSAPSPFWPTHRARPNIYDPFAEIFADPLWKARHFQQPATPTETPTPATAEQRSETAQIDAQQPAPQAATTAADPSLQQQQQHQQQSAQQVYADYIRRVQEERLRAAEERRQLQEQRYAAQLREQQEQARREQELREQLLKHRQEQEQRRRQELQDRARREQEQREQIMRLRQQQRQEQLDQLREQQRQQQQQQQLDKRQASTQPQQQSQGPSPRASRGRFVERRLVENPNARKDTRSKQPKPSVEDGVAWQAGGIWAPVDPQPQPVDEHAQAKEMLTEFLVSTQRPHN